MILPKIDAIKDGLEAKGVMAASRGRFMGVSARSTHCQTKSSDEGDISRPPKGRFSRKKCSCPTFGITCGLGQLPIRRLEGPGDQSLVA